MKKMILFGVLSLLLASAVFASFQMGENYSIEDRYSPKEIIKGWINISFQNESADSVLSSGKNFSGSASLMNFLNENGIDCSYSDECSCFPADCKSKYKAEGAGKSAKNFSLGYNKEKTLAFALNGKIDNIYDLSFDVTASNLPLCRNPLEMDILDDGAIDWKSEKISEDYSCKEGNGRGCFDSHETLKEAYLGSRPFCEKIKLLPSSKFKLGAWIKKDEDSSNPEDYLQMKLYDSDGTELVSCDLPEPSTEGGDISCITNYLNGELKDYYVCVKAKNEDITKYKVQRENTNPCGCNDESPCEEFTYDYNIFAFGAKFDNIGEFSFNDEDLTSDIESYIESRYNNDCTEGCSIPVKFKSNSPSVDIEISNLKLNYWSEGGVTETKIYDVSMKPPVINSGFIKLDLSHAKIKVPEDYGNHSLNLYLNDKLILSRNIEVEKLPLIRNVFPSMVSAALPTKFIALVSGLTNKSIISYSWNFGDGASEATNENHVIHTYANTGEYKLRLDVEDEGGLKSSKEFTITAKSPEQAVNETLRNYKEKLNNITSQISAMPSWYRGIIEKKLNLDSLVSELNVLERKYGAASGDKDYTEIMDDLIKIKIPYKISDSTGGSIPFFINVDNINPSYLEELGAGSFEEKDSGAYKETVARWTENTLVMKLEFKYILAYYETGTQNLAGIFRLKINPPEERMGDLYMIIENQNVKFKEDQKTKELPNGAVGVVFPDIKSREIAFSVSDTTLDNLIMYLSPEFSQINFQIIKPCNYNGRCEPDLREDWKNCRADCKPWGIVLILMIILLFIALTAYILLQQWYKRKYEGHLFKSKNDLFNLMNFIKNARKQGMADKEIIKKLKKAGWKKEQIKYAFKKIQGKAIMPFDFLKLFQRKKKISSGMAKENPLMQKKFRTKGSAPFQNREPISENFSSQKIRLK